jgi:hypothetical protein
MGEGRDVWESEEWGRPGWLALHAHNLGVVLSRFFEQPLHPLPDRIAFSRFSDPYGFVPLELAVDGALRASAPGPLGPPRRR